MTTSDATVPPHPASRPLSQRVMMAAWQDPQDGMFLATEASNTDSDPVHSLRYATAELAAIGEVRKVCDNLGPLRAVRVYPQDTSPNVLFYVENDDIPESGAAPSLPVVPAAGICDRPATEHRWNVIDSASWRREVPSVAPQHGVIWQQRVLPTNGGEENCCVFVVRARHDEVEVRFGFLELQPADVDELGAKIPALAAALRLAGETRQQWLDQQATQTVEPLKAPPAGTPMYYSYLKGEINARLAAAQRDEDLAANVEEWGRDKIAARLQQRAAIERQQVQGLIETWGIKR